MIQRFLSVCLLAGALCGLQAACTASTAEAQISLPGTSLEGSPRYQIYLAARRSPGKAVGYELLFPGAGNIYTGIYANAVITAVVSLVGAALWIHGGVKNQNSTYWTGVGLFSAGRVYGLVTAPAGAAMLNAALRYQLRLEVAPTWMRLRF